MPHISVTGGAPAKKTSVSDGSTTKGAVVIETTTTKQTTVPAPAAPAKKS